MKFVKMTKSSKHRIPLAKLFPSVVTVMAICFGMSAIGYAIKQEWQISVAYIIISGFLDIVDGRLARFLKATSNFGAQLDSLADFVNFGIAPSLVLYLWCLNQIGIKGLGWAFVLFYSICSAVRLARFNSDLIDEKAKKSFNDAFFKGVPAPAGAYLAMLPMMLSFNFEVLSYLKPLYIGIYLLIIGLFMASRIPTFATKKIVISKDKIPLVLVFAGFFIGSIFLAPWISLPLYGIIYLVSIPLSLIAYKRQELSQNESINSKSL